MTPSGADSGEKGKAVTLSREKTARESTTNVSDCAPSAGVRAARYLAPVRALPLLISLPLASTAVYGELRSLGTALERTPWLRQLDSWGRPS